MSISKEKWFFLLSVCALELGLKSAYASQPGILILAHGSSHGSHEKVGGHGPGEWEHTVLEAVGEATSRVSATIEVAFGMWERDAFQEGVDLLASQGVDELRVVPLYISSHSVLNQIQRYQFGLFPGSSFLPFTPGRVEIPSSIREINFASALDDSAELSDILIDRAKELRRFPEKEELILVAHGPVTDLEDRLWIEDLETHAKRIQDALSRDAAPFAATHVQTLRDDAPPWVRDEMTRRLRETVQGVTERGRTALILPVLLAPGGIEEGLLDRLKGLSYRYLGNMVAPHPRLVDWIVRESAIGR